MKDTLRDRTFSWLECRRPKETGQSVIGNAGDPQEQDIQLAGMQLTTRERIFSYLECRRPRWTGHSDGWNEGDPQEQDV